MQQNSHFAAPHKALQTTQSVNSILQPSVRFSGVKSSFSICLLIPFNDDFTCYLLLCHRWVSLFSEWSNASSFISLFPFIVSLSLLISTACSHVSPSSVTSNVISRLRFNDVNMIAWKTAHMSKKEKKENQFEIVVQYRWREENMLFQLTRIKVHIPHIVKGAITKRTDTMSLRILIFIVYYYKILSLDQ